MKLRIARWIKKHLGDDWGGNSCPPGILAELDFGSQDDDGSPMLVARTYIDDGMTLWLGYRNQWRLSFSDYDARRLARMILWDWWAWGTWFGLKRWIWYKALHVVVESHKRHAPSNNAVHLTPAAAGSRDDNDTEPQAQVTADR